MIHLLFRSAVFDETLQDVVSENAAEKGTSKKCV